MWSLVDNIPLIAQEYPNQVKETKSYRTHLFNWKIPYTHLRTCLGKHFRNLDEDQFKVDGKWMKSGADNPLFYELIKQVEPSKIYCNREIVCVYNDANPLNDYKIRAEEQNRNANMSYANAISFEDLVKGKTVAVVGNAKSLEQSQFGDCIDQHDIVIRFNRALEHPINCQSHGSKTDVWVMWRAGEYKNIISLYKNKKMIQAAYFLDCESDQIEVAPQAVYTDLFAQIGKDPSSGLVILEWLNRLDPKSVDVYGFDWKKTPTIHADKTSKYIDNLHDFEKEKISYLIVRNYKFNIMEKNLTKKY